MLSTLKIRRYSAKQFPGSRRQKPPVRKLNTLVGKTIESEKEILAALLRDVEVRRNVLGFNPTRSDTFLVWKDFAQAWEYTEVDPSKLPTWLELGEYLKIHLVYQAVLLLGGFSFTIRIRPDLQARWTNGNALDRIKRLVGKELKKSGLSQLEYVFVVESKARRGSRASLHLHGFFLADSPTLATKFKVAMSNAIADHPAGRAAAAYKPKSGPSIDLQKSYVKANVPREIGRMRWPDYILKHALKNDSRLVGRRIHISRTATQTARAFWEFIREEGDLNHVDLSD